MAILEREGNAFDTAIARRVRAPRSWEPVPFWLTAASHPAMPLSHYRPTC
jgi:hypothetical protein